MKMCSLMDLELAKAAKTLVEEMIKVKCGEEVLIYADTESDWKVVEETAKAVYNSCGKVTVVRYPAPRGVAEAADPDVPKALAAAMLNCDILIEFSNKYLLYSSAWIRAMQTNRVRYLCLSGMTADMMIRCIGKVHIPTLVEFQEKLAELTRNAKKMRITSPAGMDVEFENNPERPVFVEGIVKDKPGEYMLIGQVDWAPIEESVNGKIVFDGSLWPPEEIGVLKNPICLNVEKGVVRKIYGGHEAKLLERWLKSFEDSAMFNIAHISYGCNPGAKLSGYIIEDERVWGSIEWGLGHQAESFKGKAGPAKSHTDGICLNASIWIDGKQISNEGVFVHPELAALARKLGK
ncbi:MAG: aminopeptidase [Candidatus Bathyarchaeia archaeon]